jgi:hypothetical protein
MSASQATKPARLTQAEQAAFEQIAARSRRRTEDGPSERGGCCENSGLSPLVADASSSAGEDRTERSAASTARNSAGRSTPVGASSESSARLLETEQKSVDVAVEAVGDYEMRRCRCRSRFCEHCCLPEGIGTLKRVRQVAATFKGLLMWTFTLDPTLFKSPQEAYTYVQLKRCIGEVVRSVKKRGLLHSDRYFCVLEWQKNGWPHWHVLVDADFISIEIVQARWDCFRPENAGPIEAGRPGFGYVFVSKRDFESPDHAANYACKYITKHPQHGFPDWVLDSHGEVKRYWASKGFYDCLPEEEAAGDDASGSDPEAAEESPDAEKIKTTIRERIARCGHGVSLLKRRVVKFLGGTRIEWDFIERFPGIDLEDVCEVLGFEAPRNSWGIMLRPEAVRLWERFLKGDEVGRGKNAARAKGKEGQRDG